MQNKMSDLNNHLFAQLERLGDEDITGDELAEEIDRAKAISGVAGQIIANAQLAIKAAEFMAINNADATPRLPPMWE